MLVLLVWLLWDCVSRVVCFLRYFCWCWMNWLSNVCFLFRISKGWYFFFILVRVVMILFICCFCWCMCVVLCSSMWFILLRCSLFIRLLSWVEVLMLGS